MAAVAQRLAKAHVPIEEYPQTVPNLTAATQNLFDLIQAAAGAVPRRRHAAGGQPRDHRRERRGWRLDKLKQQHKIDVVVACQMARSPPCAGKGSPVTTCSRPACIDDDADDRQAVTSVIGASWARIFMPVLEFGRDEPH